MALSCSWCKAAYHNKDTCFNIQRIGEECLLGEIEICNYSYELYYFKYFLISNISFIIICDIFLGVHKSIIVPPSWIIKLPRKGSFKSSLRKSNKKRPSGKKRSKEKVILQF